MAGGAGRTQNHSHVNKHFCGKSRTWKRTSSYSTYLCVCVCVCAFVCVFVCVCVCLCVCDYGDKTLVLDPPMLSQNNTVLLLYNYGSRRLSENSSRKMSLVLSRQSGNCLLYDQGDWVQLRCVKPILICSPL